MISNRLLPISDGHDSHNGRDRQNRRDMRDRRAHQDGRDGRKHHNRRVSQLDLISVLKSWLLMAIYRYRNIRVIAATTAAALTFLVLNIHQSKLPSTPTATQKRTASDTEQISSANTDLTNTGQASAKQASLAQKLPGLTRGVAVPTSRASSEAISAGDYVDVYALSTSLLTVKNVLVVTSGEDSTVIAVPIPEVSSVVDALTSGGVILTLVPG